MSVPVLPQTDLGSRAEFRSRSSSARGAPACQHSELLRPWAFRSVSNPRELEQTWRPREDPPLWHTEEGEGEAHKQNKIAAESQKLQCLRFITDNKCSCCFLRRYCSRTEDPPAPEKPRRRGLRTNRCSTSLFPCYLWSCRPSTAVARRAAKSSTPKRPFLGSGRRLLQQPSHFVAFFKIDLLDTVRTSDKQTNTLSLCRFGRGRRRRRRMIFTMSCVLQRKQNKRESQNAKKLCTGILWLTLFACLMYRRVECSLIFISWARALPPSQHAGRWIHESVKFGSNAWFRKQSIRGERNRRNNFTNWRTNFLLRGSPGFHVPAVSSTVRA